MFCTSSTLTVKYYIFTVTRGHSVFILCVQLTEDLFQAKLETLVSMPQLTISDKLLQS